MTSLSKWNKQFKAIQKAEEEKKNAPNATELRNKKSDENKEALIEQYVKMQNGTPTASDTTAYNTLAMRTNKPLLTPKKKSTEKDNKGNPKSSEDAVFCLLYTSPSPRD